MHHHGVGGGQLLLLPSDVVGQRALDIDAPWIAGRVEAPPVLDQTFSVHHRVPPHRKEVGLHDLQAPDPRCATPSRRRESLRERGSG